MQDSELYDKITQAVGRAKKQSGERGLGPNPDDALDLWQVTGKIRSVLEDMHSRVNIMKLQQYHGTKWFKCPRVNCHRYHQGFETSHQRKSHVNKHERPFLCFVGNCHMKLFGCATAGELKIHLFKYHGIIEFNDKDEAEIPDLRKGKASRQAKTAATFQCKVCLQKFTTSHSLKSHMDSHDDLRLFKCNICGVSFNRKHDCKRHERTKHGPKPFICTGTLKAGGGTWGCGLSFSRSDHLHQHLRSNKGRQCLRPVMMEKLQESGGGEGLTDSNMLADQLGETADALLRSGSLLPSFGEFLQLCGLDKSALRHDFEATS